MKTEVAVKQSTEVSTELMGAWGAGGGEDFDQGDILTPRIILLQKMSKLVDEGIGKAGDFIDSLEMNVLGGIDNPIEILVFDRVKNFKVLNVTGGTPVYVRMEPFTSGEIEMEWKEGAQSFRRDRVITYSCMLVKKGGDLSEELPYLISFSRSTLQASRKIQTNIEKWKIMNQPSAKATFLLSVKKETNEKGTWFVPDVKVGRLSTPEELAVTKRWYDSIRAGAVKMQAHDIDEEALVQEAPKYAKPRETYTVDDADADDIEF